MNRRPRYAIYTAVLPNYRQACINILHESLGEDLVLYCGDEHLEATVRTGIRSQQYVQVRNLALLRRRILLQLGHWPHVLSVETAVLDLNPRSMTSWILLTARRTLGRRTIVWGHLHPQAGGNSATARVRRLLRRLSHGTIVYGYDQYASAIREMRHQPVWVAPNALYSKKDLVESAKPLKQDRVLYVGRLEMEKKPDLLLRAYAKSRLPSQGVVLSFVGQGAAEPLLRELACRLRVDSFVEFAGPIFGAAELKDIYARAVASVSPGYVGLSLTQSLGFGVPMIVADGERHSPELELARLGPVSFFTANSVDSLAHALDEASDNPTACGRASMFVTNYYCAEAMADGLRRAILGQAQPIADEVKVCFNLPTWR